MCLCEAWGLRHMCLLAFGNLVVLWVSLGAAEGIWGKAGGQKSVETQQVLGVCHSGHVQESCSQQMQLKSELRQ